MNPSPLDKQRAKTNPWKFSAKQCMALRLLCEYGCTKRIEREVPTAEINCRNVEHHLMRARKLMGLFGNDIRLYIQWDRWARKEKANDE